MTVDGRLAGFVLVARGERDGDDPWVWDVAEFFIVRRERRRGVGGAAAADVWRRFPGAWQVRVLERNGPALAFWAATIGALTDAAVEHTTTDPQGRTWRVFTFPVPARPRLRRRRDT